MIELDARTCGDFARSSKLEWLETNGAGGFAMGTVAGVNTRRYHGLLVAALQPPVDRHLLLARLEEAVQADKDGNPRAELATNQYPGAVSPEGYRRLVSFRLDPFPTWVFDVGSAQIEKQVFLVQGEQTVVIQYRATHARRLHVRPLLAMRGYHSLARANTTLNGTAEQSRTPGALTLQLKPYPSLPALRLHASPGASFHADADWYYRNEYLEELERGLDYREDLFCPGYFNLDLRPLVTAFVVATIGDGAFDANAVAGLAQAERARRKPSARASFKGSLETAADQFLVARADGTPTVIAGYPWFTDWGRDTMISLPGLLICRGRLDQAREVIRSFLRFLDLGVIPNRFPDQAGEPPEYNTVDATLWLLQAGHAWLQAGGEPSFRAELYRAAKEILRWHEEGTHHGIRADPADGLLAAGDPSVQLTWMDARVGDRVVTPRHGKPVEINALYYNALRLAALWGEAEGEPDAAGRFLALAERVRDSFQRAFWNEARGCLYDVIGPEGKDSSLRPNQLFAVSLPFPLLPPAQQQAVVRAAERELLTPVGLRTLARGDAGYIGSYRGSVAERDGAYHQGTVWPWLLGPYIRAYLAAFGRSAATVAHCRSLLGPLEQHLRDEACLGSISEVFAGDEPHQPAGAPAQAWSVSELLALLSVELASAPEESP